MADNEQDKLGGQNPSTAFNKIAASNDEDKQGSGGQGNLVGKNPLALFAPTTVEGIPGLTTPAALKFYEGFFDEMNRLLADKKLQIDLENQQRRERSSITEDIRRPPPPPGAITRRPKS